MMTTFDIMTIFWQKLDVSPVKAAISGGIYKASSPLNSNVEDVVINCLPVNFEQLQEGIVNVNVHIPNLKIHSTEIQDYTTPDLPRLKAISDLVIAALDDTWSGSYHFNVQQQVLIHDQETNNFYNNIRFNFYSINITN